MLCAFAPAAPAHPNETFTMFCWHIPEHTYQLQQRLGVFYSSTPLLPILILLGQLLFYIIVCFLIECLLHLKNFDVALISHILIFAVMICFYAVVCTLRSVVHHLFLFPSYFIFSLCSNLLFTLKIFDKLCLQIDDMKKKFWVLIYLMLWFEHSGHPTSCGNSWSAI